MIFSFWRSKSNFMLARWLFVKYFLSAVLTKIQQNICDSVPLGRFYSISYIKHEEDFFNRFLNNEVLLAEPFFNPLTPNI